MQLINVRILCIDMALNCPAVLSSLQCDVRCASVARQYITNIKTKCWLCTSIHYVLISTRTAGVAVQLQKHIYQR